MSENPSESNFLHKLNKIIPFAVLGIMVTMFFYILNQNTTINDLKIKIGQFERGEKDDSIYTDVTGIKNDTIRGILDLVEREKKLINYLNDNEIKEVYTRDAEYIKKIGGKVYSSTGYDQISKQYKNTDLRIDEVNKFNFRIYYTKYDERQRPVEANLTYDIFIKYSFNNEEKYELKTGKELMKLVYDSNKKRWLIKYFYIESA